MTTDIQTVTAYCFTCRARTRQDVERFSDGQEAATCRKCEGTSYGPRSD